ncbi:MAG: hypothetical protein HQM03_01965 [Magnetococcales bacterium]|nr:hypothetical protein [Magnetococcales bacterium]
MIGHHSLEETKLITCILPDDGREYALLKALRDHHGIIATHNFPCRGLQTSQDKDKKMITSSVQLLKVVVAKEQAEEIFAFLYEQAGFDKPIQAGCLMYQGELLGSTAFMLPQGIAMETEE